MKTDKIKAAIVSTGFGRVCTRPTGLRPCQDDLLSNGVQSRMEEMHRPLGFISSLVLRAGLKVVLTAVAMLL